MEPSYCPFCGNKNIELLEPTEMYVDSDIWIIYHYECQLCNEIFDKIYLKDEGALSDEIENEDRLWS